VTGRKRYLKEKTKRWLRMKGFPPAPVFFAPGFRSFLSHERFKFELIRRLKASWPNITIGIGDRNSDARAYLANGLRAIIIRGKGPCPPGATGVRDWRAIRGLLLE
jgi:phosphoglycolate phosphatase-like HAD superfamily hydrolase